MNAKLMKLSVASFACLVAVDGLARPAVGQCAGTHAVTNPTTNQWTNMALEGDTLLIAGGLSPVYQRGRLGTPEPEDDYWVRIDELPFGASGGIAMSGTTILASYVFFERQDQGTPADPFDDSWLEVGRLQGDYPAYLNSQNGFGRTVALEGRTALVSAVYEGAHNQLLGAVYVFGRDEGGTPADPLDDSWVKVAKLLPNESLSLLTNVEFGTAVALEGNVALIGAPRKAHVSVFGRDDGGTPDDPFDDEWLDLGELQTDLADDYSFGAAIALQGDLALVGVPSSGSGRVCAFHRDDAGTPGDPRDDVWTETFQLAAADGVNGDAFGCSLSLLEDRVLVGANYAGYGQGTFTGYGSAFLFERQDAGTPLEPLDDPWVQLEKYRPVDATGKLGSFGALLDDEVLVGGLYHLYWYHIGEPCEAFVGPRPGAPGANPECLTSRTLPVLDGEWRLEVDNTDHPHPAITCLFAVDRPLFGVIWISIDGAYWTQLLVDIMNGQPIVTTVTPANPGGLDVFVYPVPSDPALIGLQMFVQGAVLGGGYGYLSNALNAVAGVAPGP